MFHVTKAALAHLQPGAAVINSASVTAYRGSPHLIDYAATKGAIVAFTRSLAENLKERRIRVNAVAPGPVWTPLIPASFPAEHVEHFGEDTLLGRPAEPDEVAPSYIFLASRGRGVHDRPGAPPQRRRGRQRLIRRLGPKVVEASLGPGEHRWASFFWADSRRGPGRGRDGLPPEPA